MAVASPMLLSSRMWCVGQVGGLCQEQTLGLRGDDGLHAFRMIPLRPVGDPRQPLDGGRRL